jgi:hypothetical protein
MTRSSARCLLRCRRSSGGCRVELAQYVVRRLERLSFPQRVTPVNGRNDGELRLGGGRALGPFERVGASRIGTSGLPVLAAPDKVGDEQETPAPKPSAPIVLTKFVVSQPKTRWVRVDASWRPHESRDVHREERDVEERDVEERIVLSDEPEYRTLEYPGMERLAKHG